MTIGFVKMHGAANDFIVIDHRQSVLPEPLAPWIARVCDRRRGVGADGVLLLELDPELDFAMRYFNSDGGPADYCGNGARCLARFALDLGLGSQGRVRFRTAVGAQEARARDAGGIELHFGFVAGPAAPRALDVPGHRFEGRFVVAGVPHFVTAVEDLAAVPIGDWGSALRHHRALGSAGANVDFVTRLSDGRIAMRTYERGVEAETLACGSGAIASALWAGSEGSSSPVRVITAGGDELVVDFVEAADGWDVHLTGPAEVSFRGEWAESALAHAAESKGGVRCSKD